MGLDLALPLIVIRSLSSCRGYPKLLELAYPVSLPVQGFQHIFHGQPMAVTGIGCEMPGLCAEVPLQVFQPVLVRPHLKPQPDHNCDVPGASDVFVDPGAPVAFQLVIQQMFHVTCCLMWAGRTHD